MKAKAYPTVASYVAALPDGWSSFPTCRAHASLLKNLRDRGALDGLDALPPALVPGDLADQLASDAVWIPEVVHVAVLLAVRDVRFGARANADEDFLEWLAQLNRELLDGPLRGLASSPAELVPHLVAIWEAFHAGTSAQIRDAGPNGVTFALSHPAALFPPLTREGHRRVIGLALVKVGAVQPEVVMKAGLTETSFVATWR